MSDNRRLKDKLLKLASEASSIEDGWRRIGPRSGGGLLAAMLSEIDETVLARDISLRNDRGDILRLEAGNRRLKRLVSPGPSGLSDFGGLFDVAISEPSDEMLETMGRMFAVFGEGSEALFVRSENPAKDSDASLIGVSATALAAAWSVELGASSQIDLDQAFGAFTGAMASAAAAWISFANGEVAETSAPGDHVEWLENCRTADWQKHLDAHRRHTLAADGPVLCILAAQGAPDTHLLISGFGPLVNVALVEAPALTEITAKWRNLGF